MARLRPHRQANIAGRLPTGHRGARSFCVSRPSGSTIGSSAPRRDPGRRRRIRRAAALRPPRAPPRSVDEGYTTGPRRTTIRPTPTRPDPGAGGAGDAGAHRTSCPTGGYLDAACGTGRAHGVPDRQGGQTVVGCDATRRCSTRLGRSSPRSNFSRADLSELPFEDGSFQSIDLRLRGRSRAATWARRRKSSLGCSSPVVPRRSRAPHPFITGVLCWRAPVFDAEGNGWEIPEYAHLGRDISRRSPARGWSGGLATSRG